MHHHSTRNKFGNIKAALITKADDLTSIQKKRGGRVTSSFRETKMKGGIKMPRIHAVNRKKDLGSSPGLVQHRVVDYPEVVPEPDDDGPFARPRVGILVGRVPLHGCLGDGIHLLGVNARDGENGWQRRRGRRRGKG